MLHLLLIALAVTLFASDALGTTLRVAPLSAGETALATLGAQFVVAFTGFVWVRLREEPVRPATPAGSGALPPPDDAPPRSRCTRSASSRSGGSTPPRRGGGLGAARRGARHASPAAGVPASWAAYARGPGDLGSHALRSLDEGGTVSPPPRSAPAPRLEQFRQGAASCSCPSRSSGRGTSRSSCSPIAPGGGSRASRARLRRGPVAGVAVAFVLTPP